MQASKQEVSKDNQKRKLGALLEVLIVSTKLGLTSLVDRLLT